MASKGHKALKG